MTEIQLILQNSQWMGKELLRKGGLQKSSKREISELCEVLQKNITHLSQILPLSIVKHKSALITEIIEKHNGSVRAWYSSKNLRSMV